MIYLGWIMKPLPIDKELVLMLPFRQVQDRNKVIMAFVWRKTNQLLCNKQRENGVKPDNCALFSISTMSQCTTVIFQQFIIE